MADPAVEFEGVAKRFAGRSALDGFSLSVGAGETVALIGPSGCGKTTALKLVNRLLDADAGSVRVLGRDVRGEDPIALRRKLGYVIQEGGLLSALERGRERRDGPEAARLAGGGPRGAARRSCSTMVGLPAAEFAARGPRQLSGGQRQRVGVARALAADPPIVLMDEPFGALDPIARRGLQREFLDWKRRLGKAVLLVTHDLREAFRLADRIALMDRGRVRQVGTRERASREPPADDFVREFVSEEAL